MLGILQNLDQHNFYSMQTIIIFTFPNNFSFLQPATCNHTYNSRFQVHGIPNIRIYAFIHLKVICGFYDAGFRFWLKINVYFFIT